MSVKESGFDSAGAEHVYELSENGSSQDLGVKGEAPASGNPVTGLDASGADSYATIVTADHTCHYLRVQMDSGEDAVISFDNGVTENIFVDGSADVDYLYEGLIIPAGAIKAKNATLGVAATGSVTLTGNPADGNTITIDDGINTATTFEFDSGVVATGSITLTGNPADGNTITINDGAHTATVLEFDVGVKASGTISLSAPPADANTITLNDGSNPAVVFEFDRGAEATGTVSFSANPADGNSVVISDGTTAVTFEFDNGVAASGTITLTGNPADGNTVTLAGVTFEFDSGVAATGSVAMIDLPVDTDALTISDGTTSVTFEFDDNAGVTPGNTAVTIGASVDATIANLITAINNEAFNVTASPTDPAGQSCTLANDNVGVAGNVAITKVFATPGDCTVVGMSGGVDAGDAVTGGNTGVIIGATKEDTAASLLAAINLATLSVEITATPSDPADNIVNLTADSAGESGNVTITKNGANITVAGLTGGVDAGDDVTPGNVGVVVGASKEATMVNLISTINANAFNVTASPNDPADAGCTLQNDAVGTDGNVTITKDGANIGVTGMSGGQAAGSAITPGRVGVAIAGTAILTMANLVTAINTAASLDITATDVLDGSCTVENDAVGTAGNQTTLKSGANITVTGLSGGLAAGTAVGAGHTGVAIGVNKEATMANVVTVVNGLGTLDVNATASTPPDNVCTLANAQSGDAGNVVITKSGANITVTGMSGGIDPAEAVTPGNVGVALGATKEDSMVNLITIVNGVDDLAVTATPATPPDGTCTLANDVPGTHGNETVTKSGANITVAGMSSGTTLSYTNLRLTAW